MVRALLVFSGGQDSTTCLFWAKQELLNDSEREDLRANLKLISFNYGQRHSVELEAAKTIANNLALDFDLLEIPQLLRSSSPLINHQSTLEQHQSLTEFKTGIPATFVPGRNILFLTLAANIALNHGITNIVTGLCQTDFAGYYDCREDFVLAMQRSLSEGLLGQSIGINIHTPLMHLTKAETVKLAYSLGQEAWENTLLSYSCYAGGTIPCGTCHACLLRARGFAEAGFEQ